MTTAQKIIKNFALVFAIFLILSIFSTIMGAVTLFGEQTDGNDATKDLKNYSVSAEIKTLKIEVGVARLNIMTADTFSVSSNIKKLEVNENDGVLTIRNDVSRVKNLNKAVINLCIPRDCQLEKADIQVGMGRLTVDTLSANSLFLELHAGRASITELNATEESKIDGGAGEITISGGALRNLDLEIGVGKIDLTAALTGKSQFACGLGKARLTLMGCETDYKLKFDKGIGSATVSGEKMEDGSVFGSGESEIEMESGVGAVKVDFTEK